MRVLPSLILITACLQFSGCQELQPDLPETETEIRVTVLPKTDLNSELENLIQVGERIFSGGEPKSKEAFAQIAALGCKTIVSVDGAKPNLKLAKMYDLNYVHIPIGYDGLDQNQQGSIARVIRENSGSIYFHCHHGKHRGPAAAAIGLMVDTGCDHAVARKLLELAGTGSEYPGLWKDVAQFQPPAENAELPPLTAVAEVDSFVTAMAELSRAFDELASCRDAGWQSPANHPDLVPLTSATLVREGFAESRRFAEDQPAELSGWLADAEQQAVQVEQGLRDQKLEQVESAWKNLHNGCKQCHHKYRD